MATLRQDALVVLMIAMMAYIIVQFNKFDQRFNKLEGKLDGFIASFHASRTFLNTTEMEIAVECAHEAVFFFPTLQCTGFAYERANIKTVLTAAHCVQDCTHAAVTGTCPTMPNAVNFTGMHKSTSGVATNVTCNVRKNLYKPNVVSADVAVLDCAALPAGVAALKRSAAAVNPHAPVALAGIAADIFPSGAHHYAGNRSLRFVNTHRVQSAGIGVPTAAAGKLLLANGESVDPGLYAVAGFTAAQVTPGMSGGVVLDMANGCSVLGVAVATAQHGVFAPLDGADEFLEQSAKV